MSERANGTENGKARAARPRNLVQRGDGKTINVFRRPGQFFVCGYG
jgi:hypothetical protein